MIQVTINLYEFAELSESAKQRAIDEHKVFLDSEPVEFEENGVIETSLYSDNSEDEVIEIIEANGYLFFGSGELAPVEEWNRIN